MLSVGSTTMVLQSSLAKSLPSDASSSSFPVLVSSRVMVMRFKGLPEVRHAVNVLSRWLTLTSEEIWSLFEKSVSPGTPNWSLLSAKQFLGGF